MDLNSIFKKLVESDAPEDWRKVGNGITRETAYHRGDVNLRLETSIDDDHAQNDNFMAPWANKFPDKTAKGWYVDLYYASTLIHRFVLVSVDGARAQLPLPRAGTQTVPLINYRVAQVFDSGDLGDYLIRSGLTVERDFVQPE